MAYYDIKRVRFMNRIVEIVWRYDWPQSVEVVKGLPLGFSNVDQDRSKWNEVTRLLFERLLRRRIVVNEKGWIREEPLKFWDDPSEF